MTETNQSHKIFEDSHDSQAYADSTVNYFSCEIL